MTGLHLAQYRIDAELGRGGMGIVYKATDTKLNRTVALKVLPAAALSSDDDRARFVREAQSAAQLHHPNIATVFGIDEAIPVEEGKDPQPGTETRLFIAMEFIEGETLADLVKKGPMKLQDAVNVAGQVAEALKEAHAKQIVHRDIKSANVMLTTGGVAKVLDFGLAKTNQSTMLTRMGSTLGTVAYMSPEQARGQEVDGRTDLYSLGTMLYEMVAGRLPFAGDYEQAVLYGIMNEPPEPLTALRTGVPLELERIVSKLLSKEAEYRYQTAADLLADLKSLSLGGSGTTRRSIPAAPATQQASNGRSINPVLVGAGAAVVLAVGLVAGGFLFGSKSPDSAPGRYHVRMPGLASVEALDVTFDGRYEAVAGVTPEGDKAIGIVTRSTGTLALIERGPVFWSPALSPDGHWLAYGGITGLQQVSMPSGSPSPAIDVLAYALRVAWTRDSRLVFWPYTVSPGLDAPTDAIWMRDEDGTGVARVAMPVEDDWNLWPLSGLPDPDRMLAQVSSATGTRLVVVDLRTGVYETVVSNAHDGKYIASGHLVYRGIRPSGDVLMVQPFDASALRTTGPAVPLDLGAADGPVVVDGKGILVAMESDASMLSLVWLDPDGRQGRGVTEAVPMDAGYYPSISVSPDGRRIAFIDASDPVDFGLVSVFDPRNGSTIRLSDIGTAQDVVWSPDGRTVLFSGDIEDSRVLRAPTDGSGRVDTIRVPQDYAREANPSPDGRWIAYMAPGPTGVWNLYAVSTDGGQVVTIAESEQYLLDPAFSPDSRFVAFERTFGIGHFGSGHEIRVREFNGTSEWVVSEGSPTDRFWDPVWSPDGKWLYFQSPTTVFRRRVELQPTFRPVGSTEIVAENVGFSSRFAVSPLDGRILITTALPRAAGDDASGVLVLNAFSLIRELAPPTN